MGVKEETVSPEERIVPLEKEKVLPEEKISPEEIVSAAKKEEIIPEETIPPKEKVAVPPEERVITSEEKEAKKGLASLLLASLGAIRGPAWKMALVISVIIGLVLIGIREWQRVQKKKKQI